MSDEIIQLPIENDAMDEIFQTLSQIGEVVENEQTEKRKTHSITKETITRNTAFVWHSQ